MKLDNIQLHALLKKKNINYLFHANTVSTSITFIEQGGLLSRGGIESKGLFQTAQSSDTIDKEFNIWNDVFVDSVDLHGYFPRQNLYGPICFKISIDFIINKDFNIWVTKNNPIYWNCNMSDENKYFVSVQELDENWEKYERQKKMITLRNEINPVLFDYVEEVIVDNPMLKINNTNIVFFDECVKGLKSAIGNNIILKNKFTVRRCYSCYCRNNYKGMQVSELKKLFFPLNKS